MMNIVEKIIKSKVAYYTKDDYKRVIEKYIKETAFKDIVFGIHDNERESVFISMKCKLFDEMCKTICMEEMICYKHDNENKNAMVEEVVRESGFNILHFNTEYLPLYGEDYYTFTIDLEHLRALSVKEKYSFKISNVIKDKIFDKRIIDINKLEKDLTEIIRDNPHFNKLSTNELFFIDCTNNDARSYLWEAVEDNDSVFVYTTDTKEYKLLFSTLFDFDRCRSMNILSFKVKIIEMRSV